MLDHKLHGYVGIETPAERHMTAKDVVGSGCSCGRTDLDAADFKSAWKNDARIVDRIASYLPAAEYFERIEPDFRQPVRKCASILCSCDCNLIDPSTNRVISAVLNWRQLKKQGHVLATQRPHLTARKSSLAQTGLSLHTHPFLSFQTGSYTRATR